MKKDSDIYDMCLFESLLVKTATGEIKLTRVPGGWFFSEMTEYVTPENMHRNDVSGFIPFTDQYRIDPEKTLNLAPNEDSEEHKVPDQADPPPKETGGDHAGAG
jgi:hypothetical protein